MRLSQAGISSAMSIRIYMGVHPFTEQRGLTMSRIHPPCASSRGALLQIAKACRCPRSPTKTQRVQGCGT